MSHQAPHGLGILPEDRPAEAVEQLDAALRIVTVGKWLALAALAMTLAAFGLFAWCYRVPLKVDGRGIMLVKFAGEEDTLRHVTAPASGRLGRVTVKIGSIVRAGDVLAEIDRDDLRDRIKSAEADLARLVQEDESLTRFDETEVASKIEALRQVEDALRRSVELDSGRLATSRRIASGDKSLNVRRLLNDSDTLKSRAEADAVESAIGQTRAKIQELNFSRVADAITRRREKLKRALGIREAETKRSLLVEQLEREARIISPYSGKVVDLMLTPHAPVDKGAPAALLRPLVDGPQPMEAIAFVPAGQGKKVRVGDAVEVSPDTTRRQEHGFVRGIVRSVSEIPATEQAMMAELKHKSLVASFVGPQQDKVLLSIHVTLPEGRTPRLDAGQAPANRLSWSSTVGPFQRVSAGTLCSASIVVEKRPLIALALPWLKHIVGDE
jgi:HlyD family secretion protein